MAIAVLGGCAVGLGLFLVVREALPATPALGPALRRLHQPPGQAPAAGAGPDWLGGFARWLRPPHRQLALLDRTPEQYALSVLLSALVGFATPAVASAVLFVGGVALPLAVPVVASLGLALGAGLLAHRSVLANADAARDEFRQAVCTYLDLVALQLSAAHGPVALRLAQLQMHSPWDELQELADRIGIPELGDVGAIMRSSGSEGAQVHETLRSRADSLRDQIRTDNLARAEGVTSKLDIPGSLLVFVLLGFAVYPFLARL
ncbi:secretion system protein [Micromonospora sp. D75]|nr:secretion system protein [Micromonospora sp. D75]